MIYVIPKGPGCDSCDGYGLLDGLEPCPDCGPAAAPPMSPIDDIWSMSSISDTIRAALSLLRIPPTTEDQQTAALVASLRATSDADEAERFRAMLFGEAGQ